MIDWAAEFVAALAGGVGVILGIFLERLALRRGWRGWYFDDEESHAEESD